MVILREVMSGWLNETEGRRLVGLSVSPGSWVVGGLWHHCVFGWGRLNHGMLEAWYTGIRAIIDSSLQGWDTPPYGGIVILYV